MANKSPFPGMDPWLEQFWGDIHHSIIQYSRDQIADRLPGELFAAVEETVYVMDRGIPLGRFRPDTGVFRVGSDATGATGTAEGSIAVAEPVRIRISEQPVVEGHIEIRHLVGDQPLITAIEVISPTNKLDPRNRKAYLRKREAYYGGGVNLVEIDLLRAGEPLIDVPLDQLAPSLLTPHKACVRRASATGEEDVEVEYYPLPLRQRLPGIRIPLRRTDEDIILDLQAPIDTAYEKARYALRIDYSRPPIPPLSPEDTAWATEQIARRQHREG